MFSFHKPKVYRSSTGCCICKAKSSSSRFTDSRKYENDFQECFQLSNPRQGEICNACVLLVKRFKRLPSGSERHWGHVVDARAGPGMKCMSKFKKKRDELLNSASVSEKRMKMKELLEEKDRESSPGLSEESWSDEEGILSDEDCPAPQKPPRMRRKDYIPVKRSSRSVDTVGFLDMDIWKKEAVCCGEIWKGPNNEVVLDSRYFKPCALHRRGGKDGPSAKLFSDNSSDSGYDESNHCVAALASAEVACPTVEEKQKAMVIVKQKFGDGNKPQSVCLSLTN